MHDDLKYLIAKTLDVTDFLDILGLELPDILDKFEEEISENEHALKKAVSY